MNSDFYLEQQRKLSASKFYRNFWSFWGIYSVLFYGVLGIYILALDLRNWKILLIMLCVVLFARYVVCELIEIFYRKPHPYQRLNFNVPTFWWLFSSMDSEHDAFPSQHVSCAVALSTVLYLFFPVLGFLGLAVTAMMGIARVILGYHEVIDVAWGFLIGLVSGYLVYILLSPVLFTQHF